MLTYDTEEIAKIAFDLLKDQTINEKPLNPVLVPAGPVEMDYNMMNNMMYYGNYHPMGPYPMPNFDMMGMPAAMNMPMMIYPQVMLDQNGEPMYMPDGMPMPAPMGFPYMNPMDPHVHPNSANEMGSGAAGSSSVNEATSDGQNSTENAGENEGQNSNPYWQGYPPFDMNQYMYALNAAGYDYNSMQYFLAAVNEGIFEPNVLAMMDPNMYSNGYNNSGKGFRRKKSTSDSNLNRRNSEENSNNRERSGDGKNLNSTSADSARNSNRRGTSNINAGGKKNGFAGRGDRNNMNSNSNSDRNRRGGKGRLNKEGEKGSENMKPKKAVSANFNMEEDFPNLVITLLLAIGTVTNLFRKILRWRWLVL